MICKTITWFNNQAPLVFPELWSHSCVVYSELNVLLDTVRTSCYENTSFKSHEPYISVNTIDLEAKFQLCCL